MERSTPPLGLPTTRAGVTFTITHRPSVTHDKPAVGLRDAGARSSMGSGERESKRRSFVARSLVRSFVRSLPR